MEVDDSLSAKTEEVMQIQDIVSSLLHYAGCVNLTVMAALSTTAAANTLITGIQLSWSNVTISRIMAMVLILVWL